MSVVGVPTDRRAGVFARGRSKTAEKLFDNSRLATGRRIPRAHAASLRQQRGDDESHLASGAFRVRTRLSLRRECQHEQRKPQNGTGRSSKLLSQLPDQPEADRREMVSERIGKPNPRALHDGKTDIHSRQLVQIATRRKSSQDYWRSRRSHGRMSTRPRSCIASPATPEPHRAGISIQKHKRLDHYRERCVKPRSCSRQHVPLDHVPPRGVGALLLGGLDRRVRLRWLPG